VLRNAIAPPRQVVPLDLRTTYRLVPTARLIVAAGRLSPEKGHRHLLAALALLRDEQPPVCLVLLGAGQAQGRLAAQIERAGLADRVRFAGFQREILPHLAGADLLVHPSLSEGLPNVLLEAFAVQCPVVATGVGGVPELVVPGETGRLVPPADPQSLAAAIREALAHPEATRTMAAAGRQRILADFSFQQQTAQFIDICAAALAAGPAGRSSPGPCDRFARARQPQSSAGRRQDPAAGPQAWLRMEVDR